MTPPQIRDLSDESRAVAQIWWGDADTITPPEQNALRYLRAIPGAGGRSAGADVEHYLQTEPEQDAR
jgi:hypothetical protein